MHYLISLECNRLVTTIFSVILGNMMLVEYGCFAKKGLDPGHAGECTTAVLKKADLKAIIVNNENYGDHHRAGYNGIAELYHTDQEKTLFVPVYAGFNLEHIFAGDPLIEFFEPRMHPMSLIKKSNDEVLLYQAATPLSHIESLTSYKTVPPHYIDITFKCKLYENEFITHDYIGLFWASYIDRPDDKKMYFWGFEGNDTVPEWIAAYSDLHGEKSTHIARGDAYDAFYFAADFNATLANHFSNYRYDLPCFYGRFKNMVLAYLFDSSEIIRFSQSPTGGGPESPAWDFQYIIPHPETGKEYSFRARIVYKPFINSEDIREEYQSWKENL